MFLGGISKFWLFWRLKFSLQFILTNIKKISYTLLGQTITSTTTSKILRLKSKELWLEETDDNGDVDEYHYVQY